MVANKASDMQWRGSSNPLLVPMDGRYQEFGGARVVVWVRGSVRFFATVARAVVTLHPRTHRFPTSRSEEKLTSKCCYDVGKYDSSSIEGIQREPEVMSLV